MTELAEKLSQPLDASRVKSRPNGRGGQLSYLETHDVIRAANDIFGFGKWGHDVVELRQIAGTAVHNNEGKVGYCVGYVCVIRLTVDGCVPVSGVGYGDATEYRESAAVTTHELAAKEAESDALKRALKNFGDQFGLALYDKAAATSGHVVTAASQQPPAPPASTGVRVITDPQRKRLYALSKEASMTDDDLKRLVVEIAGVESSKDIPAAKYDELCEAVQAEKIPFMPTIDGLGN